MDKETALKILRELHDKALFSERTALETLHPELAESEDERIRGAIIDIIKSQKEQQCHIDSTIYDEKIAWLEKQGEKKVSEYDVVKTIKERIIEHFDNHLIIDKCFSIGGLKDDILKIINEAKFEKQGEQKPMTEEFEHELAEICNQLLSEIDSEWMNNEILDCIGTSVWLNLCDETAKRYKDRLLKLAKQGEQKPAEWGEEDETTFKVILEELEKYVMFKQYSTPLSVYDLQWFKSLKDRVQPQPKQEWSVEDETGWTNTMIMIKEVASNHYTKDSIKLVIDWLKSLKERIGE